MAAVSLVSSVYSIEAKWGVICFLVSITCGTAFGVFFEDKAGGAAWIFWAFIGFVFLTGLCEMTYQFCRRVTEPELLGLKARNKHLESRLDEKIHKIVDVYNSSPDLIDQFWLLREAGAGQLTTDEEFQRLLTAIEGRGFHHPFDGSGLLADVNPRQFFADVNQHVANGDKAAFIAWMDNGPYGELPKVAVEIMFLKLSANYQRIPPIELPSELRNDT